MSFIIAQSQEPDAAYMPIWAPLLQFNQETVGQAQGELYARIVRSTQDGDKVEGGLWSLSLWGSFYIGLVIVPKAARGRGLGTDLMRRVEVEARDRGCRRMWLDTYAFQARSFYERLGFKVFGQIDGPGPVFPRVFMQKRLETPRSAAPVSMDSPMTR